MHSPADRRPPPGGLVRYRTPVRLQRNYPFVNFHAFVIYSAKNIFWRCCGTVVTVSQSFVNRHRLTGRIFFLPWRPANLARCLAMPQGRAMSCEELVSTLRDLQTYEVELDWKTYQVEVELLENTGKYLHVMVAVDDGSLPASLSPLTHSFVRKKLSARG